MLSMKKILIIFITIIFILSTGCYANYVTKDEYSELQQTNNKISTERDSLVEDKAELESEIYDLESQLNLVDKDLQLTKDELGKYKDLINNLNEYLSYVYKMECTNTIGGTGEGTAFSIKYNQDIYIISSGHIVDNEHGIFNNFRIRTNDGWVYLELLCYEVTNTAPDYGVFYSNKIDNGLGVDRNNTEPNFRLGNKYSNLNLINLNDDWGIDGECGSPIIDLDGEVIGIHVGYMTDIDNVLEAIDSLK